jgi:hypothetical protein
VEQPDTLVYDYVDVTEFARHTRVRLCRRYRIRLALRISHKPIRGSRATRQVHTPRSSKCTVAADYASLVPSVLDA